MAVVTVSGSVSLKVDIYERIAADLGVATQRHLIDITKAVTSGTGTDQADIVYSATLTTVAGTPTDLDLRAALATKLNIGIAFVKVTGWFIQVTTSTTGYYLLVGGDGTAPAFAGLFNSGTDKLKIQPGGFFGWYAPLSGDVMTTTATTADIMQLDGGPNAVTFKIIILGRTV